MEKVTLKSVVFPNCDRALKNRPKINSASLRLVSETLACFVPSLMKKAHVHVKSRTKYVQDIREQAADDHRPIKCHHPDDRRNIR